MREEEKREEREPRKPRGQGVWEKQESVWPKWQVFIGIRSWGKGSKAPGLQEFRKEGRVRSTGRSHRCWVSLEVKHALLVWQSTPISHLFWVTLGRGPPPSWFQEEDSHILCVSPITTASASLPGVRFLEVCQEVMLGSFILPSYNFFMPSYISMPIFLGYFNVIL